jgi:2-succinyl-6-hydroxy-2,4-cyclohexadiene-1-carboxylate synthase
VLLGYSLGARIGLYLLDLFPDLFTEAILIAPHLGGLKNPKKHLENDRKWAERFLREPLDKVTADWDDQPIFKNSTKPQRGALDVRLLSDALTLASPALQKDFRSAEFLSQVHLLAGEYDRKFIDHLTNYPRFRIIPGAGYRVLHDRPDLVGEMVAALS